MGRRRVARSPSMIWRSVRHTPHVHAQAQFVGGGRNVGEIDRHQGPGVGRAGLLELQRAHRSQPTPGLLRCAAGTGDGPRPMPRLPSMRRPGGPNGTNGRRHPVEPADDARAEWRQPDAWNLTLAGRGPSRRHGGSTPSPGSARAGHRRARW